MAGTKPGHDDKGNRFFRTTAASAEAAGGETRVYFGSLSVRMSILWMAGGLASNSPAFAISAAATLPLRWALRPASSLKVSNIENGEGPSWMANQVTVPGSASTSGSADFRNSATCFSLPGLASRETYSATFDIVSSCNGFKRGPIVPACKWRNSVRRSRSRRIDIRQRRDDGSGSGPVVLIRTARNGSVLRTTGAGASVPASLAYPDHWSRS